MKKIIRCVSLLILLSVAQFTLAAEESNPAKTAPKSLLFSGDGNSPYVMTIARNISNSQDIYSQMPAVHIDELDNIYVVWQERGAEVRLSQSNDRGESFSAPQILLPWGHYTSSYFDIVNNGTYIHITWSYYPKTGGAEVVYCRSTDIGQLFETPVIISLPDLVNSYSSRIASDDIQYIGIVWNNTDLRTSANYNNISYTYSKNNGESFSIPKVVADFGLSPDIGIFDKYVYIAFVGNSGDPTGIYLSRSDDFGLTFSAPVNLCPGCQRPWPPEIKISKTGNVYILWPDGNAFTQKNIMIAKSVDYGLTFNTSIAVPSLTASNPDVMLDDDENIYLCWTEGGYSEDENINGYIMYSKDLGATFEDPVNLTAVSVNPEESMVGIPQVEKLKNNKIVFVWHQADSIHGYPEIVWSIGENLISKPTRAIPWVPLLLLED